MIQITSREIPKYRKHLAAKQQYRCAICGCPMAGIVHTLDHCHDTGALRGVLCRPCNYTEGSIKKVMRIRVPLGHLLRDDPVAWLRRLADYLEAYDGMAPKVIHPTFDLKTGKQICKKKKRKAKKAQ